MIGSFVPEKEVAQLYNLVLECEKDTKAAHAMECVYGDIYVKYYLSGKKG